MWSAPVFLIRLFNNSSKSSMYYSAELICSTSNLRDAGVSRKKSILSSSSKKIVLEFYRIFSLTTVHWIFAGKKRLPTLFISKYRNPVPPPKSNTEITLSLLSWFNCNAVTDRKFWDNSGKKLQLPIESPTLCCCFFQYSPSHISSFWISA